MIIKILGTGCSKCKLLTQTVRDAVDELWLQAEIIKVDDMEDILQYDIVSTPGLVIDERVVVAGRIPSKAEIKIILTLNDR
jgi:small redox-active disulfide protein 2